MGRWNGALPVTGVSAFALVLSGLGGAPAPAAVQPCSNGLVALTFDDGPSREVTPRLLDVLRNRRVPATFFVVGGRVASAPWVTRRAHRQGFKIANHTYRHEQLTRLSDDRIAATLRRTRRAIVDAGARPSRLMRPPYGSINSRVRGVVADVAMVPVLWTVDPRDWEGQAGWVIARDTLSRLRPDKRNVVLLHDGIGNSPNTLRAVPRIIRQARARGYCFAGLDERGWVRPPVPRVRVSNASVSERAGVRSYLRFTLTLDRPTSRVTSVRVRTRGGTALSGVDFADRDLRVRFPVGVRKARVVVPVRVDRLDEPTERLWLRLSHRRGLRIADAVGRGLIFDNDAPPEIRLTDVEVQEPTEGTTNAMVRLGLSRQSGRWIKVRVATEPSTATTSDFDPVDRYLWFRPGRLNRQVAIPVRADTITEPAETLRLRVVERQRVRIGDGVAVVTINPPDEVSSP